MDCKLSDIQVLCLHLVCKSWPGRENFLCFPYSFSKNPLWLGFKHLQMPLHFALALCWPLGICRHSCSGMWHMRLATHPPASSAPRFLPQPQCGPGFLSCWAFAQAAAPACSHCPFFSAGLGDVTSPPGLGWKAIPCHVSPHCSWAGSWDPGGLCARTLSPDWEADVSIS